MKHTNLWIIAMVIISLLLIATCTVEAADETITDGINDVSSIDYFTGETKVVTSHPDINVEDLDITMVTYTQQGQQATLSLQVRGIIRDRGKFIDPYSEDPLTSMDAVQYEFQLITSGLEYSITYSNKTGQIYKGDEPENLTSSDYTVVGDTLTITFTLIDPNELYENLSVISTFIKANFSADIDPSALVYLSDIAPNPPLEIMDIYASNVGSIGETIQFNATIVPLTGQPPYSYRWDFGDQGSSTELNPTHAYEKAGAYTYTFRVTDQAGTSLTQTGTITISLEGGESNGPLSNQMILFLVVLLIIIVIGVVIIVWIIRR